MQLNKYESARFQIFFGRNLLRMSSQMKFDEYYFANGAYADMWQARIGEDVVAVKVWRGVSLSVQNRRCLEMQLSKQLDQWKRCHHINIVPFLGAVPRQGNLPCVVTPYYKNGHVMQYISNNPMVDKLHLITGVAAAVGYLHSLTPPIVHGDIKGSNMLVDDAGNACLSDVSIARVAFPSDWTHAHGTGSARWLAPELIDLKDEDGDEYPVTCLSDVYSFGMTVLEIISGRPPFSHRHHDTSVICDVYHGRRPPRPANSEMTDSIWALIQSCWHQEPVQRANINGVGFWLALLSQTRAAQVNTAL